MSTERAISFLPKSKILRQTVSKYRRWIESSLGVPMASTVAVTTSLPITQVGVNQVLGYRNDHYPDFRTAAKLLAHVESMTTPPREQVFVTAQTEGDYEDMDVTSAPTSGFDLHSLEWGTCPVCIRLKGTGTTMVVLRADFLPSPQSYTAESQHVIVAPQHALDEVVQLLNHLAEREARPKLHTFQGVSREVPPFSWADLVLDDNVVSLLRNDFTAFFQRKEWFRQNRLPYRRGYLLHSRPGNGKSSAIRAMMTSQKIDAYTIRFFHSDTDDDTLEKMFDKACRRKAMIVLEDLDRSFPRTGGSSCKVSMQALLNCLDGVATGDGTVVVATANQPALLDPAILRRPGRFDRVVLFPDPTPELRARYFRLLYDKFAADEIADAVALSGGYSFAQLRESYIVASQRSFDRGDPITGADLIEGVLALRQSTRVAVLPSDKAGFEAREVDGVNR
jgi:SpoVK/Ycf46/Vps4 family AAA+-type ATPase